MFEKEGLALGEFSGDGRKQEGGKRASSEDVERGKERVDEADFFVRYEGQNQGNKNSNNAELEFDGIGET